ncbi:MAG: S8 family serine peptidase, partial [Longimicrobiales bacterium]
PAAGTLSAPADADGIIAVGATDLALQPAAFSSRGPTAHGRMKPELVARGVGILAALSTNLDAYEASLSGTSLSSPLIAGSAAIVMEAWPMLDATAVRNALILSATRAHSPDNALGFGLPDVGAAVLFPGGVTPATVATIDLDGNLTTIGPEFTWSVPLVHATAGSVLYTVEVGRDSLFRNLVFSDTVRDVTTYASRAALKPASSMWWRVRAQAAQGVRFVSSPARPFTMPGWVRLVAPDPVAATFVETPRPNLTWSPLSAPSPLGPLVYDVEILSPAGQLVQPTIRNVTSSVVRVPQPLTPNQPYRWRVIARTQLGSADTVESASTFVVNVTERPPITLLQQNFPNPFPRPDLGTRETRIWFDLADATTVELIVFDLRGRLVKRLVPASPDCGTITLPPGIYGRTGVLVAPDPCVQTTWDGTDHAGRTVTAGVYVLRLRTAGQDQFRHMVFRPR